MIPAHSAFVPSRHNGWQPAQTGAGRKVRVHITNDAKSVPFLLRRIIGRALSRLTISVWHNRKPLEMLGCKPDRHLALQAVAKRRKRQAAAERGEITKHKRRMEAARNVADRLREDTGKA